MFSLSRPAHGLIRLDTLMCIALLLEENLIYPIWVILLPLSLLEPRVNVFFSPHVVSRTEIKHFGDTFCDFNDKMGKNKTYSWKLKVIKFHLTPGISSAAPVKLSFSKALLLSDYFECEFEHHTADSGSKPWVHTSVKHILKLFCIICVLNWDKTLIFQHIKDAVT